MQNCAESRITVVLFGHFLEKKHEFFSKFFEKPRVPRWYTKRTMVKKKCTRKKTHVFFLSSAKKIIFRQKAKKKSRFFSKLIKLLNFQNRKSNFSKKHQKFFYFFSWPRGLRWYDPYSSIFFITIDIWGIPQNGLIFAVIKNRITTFSY